MCDVCGQAVPAEVAIKAEVSVAQSMCPSSMTFHPACYEQASEMWQPDDSYCGTDPRFPEMAAWSKMPEASEEKA